VALRDTLWYVDKTELVKIIPIELARLFTMFFYNPILGEPEDLSASFIARIERLLRPYTTGGEVPHLLVEGPGGSGKTLLMTSLARQIESTDRAEWCRPVLLGEENYTVYDLGTLWARIAEALAEVAPRYGSLVGEIRKRVKVTVDPEYCLDLLVRHMTDDGTCLVLFVEHFERLIRKLDERERARLITVLREVAVFRWVVSSASRIELDEAMTPFVAQFERVRLTGLDVSETETLLKRRVAGDTNRWLAQRPGLPLFWHRITAGYPRLLLHLAEVIEVTRDDPFADLIALFDRVTPDYQPRLDRLPTQQQAILQVIALCWDATHAGYIAERLRLPSKLVSAQLSQMARQGLIGKRSANRKNHLYFTDDRFFQLWFLIRHGGLAQRRRLERFIAFAIVWTAPRVARETTPHLEREADLTNAARAGRAGAWSDLGTFYEARDRLEMAEIAFQKGVEAGDTRAMSALAKLCYRMHGSRTVALGMARRAVELSPEPDQRYALMRIAMWNGHVDESMNQLRGLLAGGFAEREPRALLDFLIQMAVEGRIQLLDRLFWENPDDLRDRFKPFHGALIHLLGDRYPGEYKRLSPEVATLAEEILERIERERPAAVG